MSSSDAPKAKDINAVTTKPFSQMTGVEKIIHISKVILFLLTFGFAFPNVLSD